MSARTPAFRRLNLTHRASIATLGAVGAATLALAVAPGNDTAAVASPAHTSVASAAWTSSTGQASILQTSVSQHQISADGAVKAQAAAFTKAATAKEAAKAHAAAEAKAKAAAEVKAAKAEKAAKAQAAEEKKAAAANKAAVAKKLAAAKEAAHRHAAEAPSRPVAHKPAYADNLDGWIRHSLAIMKDHKIPGSYHGIYRNVIRESSGDPHAINLWDINARNGIPSKGLLQVIPPTFATYHVAGTSHNIYDPVANIVAACNYAADRYGSMDNVNSAY